MKKILFLMTIFFASNSFADTYVGGAITGNTTWIAANSPYIVNQNISVNEGITLTIDAGVTVKFDDNLGMIVNGTLEVLGTEGSPVLLTSSSTEPESGSWGGILFTDTAIGASYTGSGTFIDGSLIEWTTFEYAGGPVGPSDNWDGVINSEMFLPYINHINIDNSIDGIVISYPVCTEDYIVTSYINNSNFSNIGFNAISIKQDSDCKINLNVINSSFSSPLASFASGSVLDVTISSGDYNQYPVTNILFKNISVTDYNSNFGEPFEGDSPARFDLSIEDSEFEGNTNDYIFRNFHYLSIDNCSFLNNDSFIVSSEITGLQVGNSSFTNNRGLIAGTSSCDGGSSLSITDSSFAQHTHTVISAYFEDSEITGCTFTDNLSDVIILEGANTDPDLLTEPTVSINNSEFIENRGHSAQVTGHYASMENNIFSGNYDNSVLSSVIEADVGYVCGTTEYDTYLEISDSVFSTNQNDFIVSFDTGGGTIEYSTITDNTSTDSSSFSAVFINNNSYPVTIYMSNIFNNESYEIYNNSSENITATSNYWGTTDTPQIALGIWDYYDNVSLGEVVFSPFLSFHSNSINDDGPFDLGDIITGLQIITGMTPTGVTTIGDINEDGKIGFEEIIHGLNILLYQ